MSRPQSVVIFTLFQRHFLFAVDRFIARVRCVLVSIPVDSQFAIASTKRHAAFNFARSACRWVLLGRKKVADVCKRRDLELSWHVLT